MNNLLEELNKYLTITNTRDNLNSELLSLSGKNDQESIKRINEIGANLNQISKSLQGYDKEKLDKVTEYYETVRELNTIKKSMNSSKEAPKKKEPQKVQAPLEPQKNLDAKLDEIYAEPTIVEPVKPSTKAPSLEEENPYIYGHYDPKPKPLTLPDLISMCEKNKIKLHPVPTTFRRKHKVDMKKAFTCIKSKVSLEKFKKLLPKVWNIDKQVELAFTNMNNRLLDKKIVIKEGTVKFAENVIQKYNTAKTHVTNIPKRTKEYIKNKYKDFKNYFREKKEISRLRKEENYSRKEAMEMVYGEKVDKHLDYRIVNRTAKFKENTCQRINTTKGKIVGTTKAVIDAIKKPFDYLRENMKNDTKRQELQAKIEEIRIANRQKEAALKRIKVNSNAGYVGTVALTIISVFALAAIIFMGIGSIINR